MNLCLAVVLSLFSCCRDFESAIFGFGKIDGPGFSAAVGLGVDSAAGGLGVDSAAGGLGVDSAAGGLGVNSAAGGLGVDSVWLDPQPAGWRFFTVELYGFVLVFW